MGGQDVLHVGLDVEKNPITRSLCSILVILMFHSLFETKHMLYWQMQGSSIGKPLLQIRRNKWYQNHVAHNMARKNADGEQYHSLAHDVELDVAPPQ
jgi:hypothetical protein